MLMRLVLLSLLATLRSLSAYPFAADYCSPQDLWATDLLRGHSFSPEAVILNIGSDRGAIAAQIASRVPEGFVLGIDNSRELVAYANATYRVSEYPNLTFRTVSDAFAYHQEFDVITSFCGLHTNCTKSSTLEQIYTSLKPGGYVLLMLPGGDTFAKMLGELVLEPKWAPYFSDATSLSCVWTREETIGLLKRRGFSNIFVFSYSANATFASREEVCSWLDQMISTAPLDSTLKPQFISAVADRLNIQKHPSGYLHILQPLLLVYATKPSCTSAAFEID